MQPRKQITERKSKDIGLSFAYDWSNPGISDDALIWGVLDRGIFEDVARVCCFFGLEQVKRIWRDMPPNKFRDRALERMLKNIEMSFEDVEV